MGEPIFLGMLVGGGVLDLMDQIGPIGGPACFLQTKPMGFGDKTTTLCLGNKYCHTGPQFQLSLEGTGCDVDLIFQNGRRFEFCL